MKAWLFLLFLGFSVSSCEKPDPVVTEPIREYTRELELNQWHLKVSSFNIWAISLISKDIKERMPEIGKALKNRQVSVALLQEAWSDQARDSVFESSSFQNSFYFKVPRTFGSGLALMTHLPIIRHSFTPFLLVGRLGDITKGDAWSGKGSAMSTLDAHTLPMSFFNTHLIARYDRQDLPEDEFSTERMMELFQVFSHIVEQTDSDAFIVAGDFNMRPHQSEYAFWKKLTSLEGTEFESQDSSACTFCGDNSYHEESEGQLDYIFTSPRIQLENASIDFRERVQIKKKSVNLSDHYGLTAGLKVGKSSFLSPSEVRQNMKESVVYLRFRLEDYLKNHSEMSKEVSPQGVEEQICVSCRIRDSIQKLRLYEQALSETEPTAGEIESLRVRLGSYIELFRD